MERIANLIWLFLYYNYFRTLIKKSIIPYIEVMQIENIYAIGWCESMK